MYPNGKLMPWFTKSMNNMYNETCNTYVEYDFKVIKDERGYITDVEFASEADAMLFLLRWT